MIGALASAVYEGRVTHCRYLPHPHRFRYRIAQLYLDLDEIDAVFRDRWLWSVNRPNLAEWRRADYLGPATQPLAEAVRERVRRVIGRSPAGPIRMLTHLRYAGHVFNPVTFYYCFDKADALEAIVAEITNTPWRERHAYVLAATAAGRRDDTLSWDFDKVFHVSPFTAMQRRYQWQLTAPAEQLRVHMRVLEGTQREFDATLQLQRRPLHGGSLARVLWRYPLMTVQVLGAIHWQALRLYLKRNPVHRHPRLGAGQESVAGSAGDQA